MAVCSALHVEHWIFLLVFLPSFHELWAVRITNLSVPRWIENGTMDSVILDCDFQQNKDEQRIVVKWFLNNDPEPIYQWIPEHDSRITSSKLTNRLDLEFKVNNKLTMHRALKILRPTTELSGMYRCDVNSLESQDSQQAPMFIYAPPKKLDFFAIETLTHGLNLTCDADNVFPQPLLHVYHIYPGEPKRERLPTRKSLKKRVDQGTFDITVTTELESTSLPDVGAAYFECEITLSGMLGNPEFTSKQRLQYYPVEPTDGANTIAGSSFALHIALLPVILMRMLS